MHSDTFVKMDQVAQKKYKKGASQFIYVCAVYTDLDGLIQIEHFFQIINERNEKLNS